MATFRPAHSLHPSPLLRAGRLFERLRSPWAWLCWIGTAAALLLAYRGAVQHWWVEILLVAPWAMRYCLSRSFQKRVKAARTRLWEMCLAYPHSSRIIPWRAAWAFVVLPAALFFLANDYVSEGDNVPIMLAASSLASEGNWELSEFVNREGHSYVGCLVQTPRGTYSGYPAGPVQFAFPVVLASRIIGGDYQSAVVLRRLHKWTAAWLAAACLGLFFLTGLHLAPAKASLTTTLLLATGSAMFTTIGQGLWQHGGILFWSQLFIFLEFHRGTSPARPATLISEGIAQAFMLACRLSAAIVLVPLTLWTCARDWRHAIRVGLLAVVFYVPWAGLYFSMYEQPFGPSVGQLNCFSWSFEHLSNSFLGILFSPARGFFVYQAWAIVVVLAVLPGGRRVMGEGTPGWRLMSLSVIALNLAMVSAWALWWGGWCWGSRLLSDSLLFVGLLCLRPIGRLLEFRWGRALVIALGTISFLVNAPGVYMGADRWNGVPDIDQAPERLWSWQHPPFIYPFQKRCDHLPISTSAAQR